MHRIFLACGLVLLLGGGEAGRSSTQSKGLLGAWDLTRAGEGDPASINIKTFRIEFREDGSWTYRGEMEGSGKWTMKEQSLEYTAGDNKGISSVSVSGNRLTLSPDPVIAVGGKTGVTTTYKRTGT